MSIWRRDPGPCIVCGAAHTACTAGDGEEIAIVQMPLRDAAASPSPLEADRVQATLPPGQFTTGTYRRRKNTPAGASTPTG
jgi:hypothetical protein